MTMQRDADRPTADGGFTLIEVVVAIMIFAIIASGVVEGMLTISRMTADDRSRVVAANLAAEDIDLVRAVGDPFKIEPATVTRSITGHTYTVTRTTSWVSSGGADISCGSAPTSSTSASTPRSPGPGSSRPPLPCRATRSSLRPAASPIRRPAPSRWP